MNHFPINVVLEPIKVRNVEDANRLDHLRQRLAPANGWIALAYVSPQYSEQP